MHEPRLLPDYTCLARQQHISSKCACDLQTSTPSTTLKMHYQQAMSPFLYLFLYSLLLNTRFFRTWIMPPVHLLAYSTLLQAQLYQTFFVLTYEALPRKAFMNLQGKFFLEYFWGQTLLIVLVALTVPPHGVYSLMKSKMSMIFFAAAGGTALLNLLVYGPRTKDLRDEVMDHCMY
jgi:hypothetical protein